MADWMLHPNGAISTVAAITDGLAGTTLDVTHSSRFPDPGDTVYHVAVWADGEVWTPTNGTILEVTNVSGATLTYTRQAEGTSNRNIQIGDNISIAVTRQVIEDIEDAITGMGVASVGSSRVQYSSVQDAIDAAAAAYTANANMVRVVINSDLELTEPLIMKTGVALHPSAPGIRLKVADGADCGIITSDGYTTADLDTGIHTYEIGPFWFDGNGANQSSQGQDGLVQIHGYNATWYSGIKFMNAYAWGLYTTWGSGLGAPGPDGIGMENSYGQMEFIGNDVGGGTGEWFNNGPHDSQCVSAILHGGTGTAYHQGTRAGGMRFEWIHPWGLEHTHCAVFESTVFAEGYFEGASSTQIEISANDWEIKGRVQNFGSSDPGIQFTGACGGYRIQCTMLGFVEAIDVNGNDNGGIIDINVYSEEVGAVEVAGGMGTGTRFASQAAGTVTKGVDQFDGGVYIPNGGIEAWGRHFTHSHATDAMTVTDPVTEEDVWNISALEKLHQMPNGGAFRTYSGPYTGLNAQIDGTNGAIQARRIVALPPGASAPPELTIAAGVIEVTDGMHLVDTEADAATDDLETVDGMLVGETVRLFAADDARTVVVKHAVGNIEMAGAADFSLDNLGDWVELHYRGGSNVYGVGYSV